MKNLIALTVVLLSANFASAQVSAETCGELRFHRGMGVTPALNVDGKEKPILLQSTDREIMVSIKSLSEGTRICVEGDLNESGWFLVTNLHLEAN